MSKKGTQDRLVNVLYWQEAENDDRAIAEAVYKKKELDAIYGMEETGLLDDFFYYLQEIGVLELIKKLKAKDVKRIMVPVIYFVVLYMLKVLFGIRSMNSLPEFLFSNEGSMKFVGFNAHQIRNGFCKRGDKKRKRKLKLGPICPDTLAKNIVKFSVRIIERFFNECIALLARAGTFDREVTGSLDTTDYQTTDKYKGRGKVTRIKEIKQKDGKKKKIEVSVFGWKVGAMMEVKTRIPLSVKITKIQVADKNFTRALVEQAIKNLGKYSRLVCVVLDRGFLDGEDLWWLKTEGCHFVIPAKKNMHILLEANALAELEERDANVFPKKRVRTVTRGKGKKAHPVQLETELVGIKNIAMLDTYGPPEHTRHANRKDFKANPLNAIVIKKWDNKKPRKGKAAVFITDLPVRNPFIGYDLYDDRSLIENCLWREEKQKWYLKNPPKRTAEGVAVHTFLTMTVFALATAFRYWNKDQQKKIEVGKTTGIQLFWRELRMKNRNKVLIFKGDKYGVFYLSEIMRLVGFRIKDADPGVGSRSQIMRKYGISRE